MRPSTISTDAPNHGLGAVLSQKSENWESGHVIAYLSRSLKKAERNYSVTERKYSTVVFAIDKCRPYVEGTHFTGLTDHFSLLWLMRMKDPTKELARWAVKLKQFGFKLIHRLAKNNAVLGPLSGPSKICRYF